MTLGATPSDFRHRFQGELFPALAQEVGTLLGTHAGEPGRLGAGLSGQGGAGPFDDAASDRQARGRPVAAAAVRLVPSRGYPERGDVFAGVCGVLCLAPGSEDA